MTYSPPFQIEHKPSNFQNAGRRTFAPKVLQVVHVTGNSRVAAYPEGFGSAESPGADWRYAALNPDSKDGPSAHNYIGRETGATIQMWNPKTHWAWSNGDLKRPNLKLPGVAYLAKLREKGVNANAGCYREIELSGYPGSFDPTDAQLEAAAYFAAIDSIATGLDIIRGETVLTHADINSVDRQNCAFRPVIREGRLGLLITRAREIRALLTRDTAGDDMPGLKVTALKPYSGFVTVVGDKHAAVQIADREYVFVPAGTRKEAVATGKLDPPLDGNPGDRSSVYLIGDELAVFLAVDVKAEPTVADCADEAKAAVGKALDSLSGPVAALAAAITEARG